MAAFRVKFNEWMERLREKNNKGGPFFDIYRVGEKYPILSICFLLDPFVVNVLKEEMSLPSGDQRFQQVVIHYAGKYIERAIRNKTLPIRPSEKTHFEPIKEEHLPEIRQLIQENTYHSDSNTWELIVELDQGELSAPQSRVVRIFLCHASEDKPQVYDVYHQLKALGFAPWLDKEDLLGGQEWAREIPRALRTSDFVLIFLSRTSVAKRGYVQREMKLALDTLQEIPEGVIHTIPVKLDNCDVPESFRPYQWINLFDSDGFDRIVRAIRAELDKRPQIAPQSATADQSEQSLNAYPEAETLNFIPRSTADILNDRKREQEGVKFQLVQENHRLHEYSRQEIDRLTSTQRERLFAADPEMKNWWRGKAITNGAWPLFRIHGGTWISKGQIEPAYEQMSEEQRRALWKIEGLNEWYMEDLVF